VNLTARLQAHASPGGILLTHESHALVKNEIEAEQQEAIRLKGLRDPVHTYKVAIPPAPIASAEEQIKRRIKADVAQLDKAAALNVLSEIQNQVECADPAGNGNCTSVEASAVSPPHLVFNLTE
jgi:hypothetical protein